MVFALKILLLIINTFYNEWSYDVPVTIITKTFEIMFKLSVCIKHLKFRLEVLVMSSLRNF